MDEGQKKKSAIAGEWLAMGIALGVAFGIIFDNLGLWLPIGVCIKDNNTNEPDKE